MNGIYFLQLSKLSRMLVESDAQHLIVIVKEKLKNNEGVFIGHKWHKQF